MPIHHLTTNAYEGPANLTLGDGNTALTHVGWVRPPGHAAPLKAVIKVYPAGRTGPTCELLNEFVGHLVAEQLQFAVPPHAGTLSIERRQWPSLDLWKKLPTRQARSVAWWSALSGSKSLKARFKVDVLLQRKGLLHKQLDAVVDELLATPGTPGVIALDEILANVDRNLGNLLGPEGDRFVLIDHGQCLTGPTWQPADLDPTRRCRNVLLALLEHAGMPLRLRSAAVATFDRIQPQLPATMTLLRSELQDLVADAVGDTIVAFLRERARRDTAAKRLGLVA